MYRLPSLSVKPCLISIPSPFLLDASAFGSIYYMQFRSHYMNIKSDCQSIHRNAAYLSKDELCGLQKMEDRYDLNMQIFIACGS